MANPLNNEAEIYERIRKENLKIHPIIWELINHHIRNDLNRISTGLGVIVFIPKWILKVASFVIKCLYKISLQPGEPPYDLDKICHSCIRGVKDISNFLKKLHDATEEEEKDKNDFNRRLQ